MLQEFAVTISVTIVVSGWCPSPSRHALRPVPEGGHGPGSGHKRGWLYRVTERGFDLTLAGYDRTLRLTLRLRLLMLLFSFVFIAGTAYYLVVLPKGFLPSEDTSQIYCTTEGPEDVSFRGMIEAQGRVAEVLRRDEDVEAFSSSIGAVGPSATSNTGRINIRLRPRAERNLSADEVIAKLRRETAKIPGIRVYFQNPPPIRIGGRAAKSLYQFTVQGPDTTTLYAGATKLEAR